MKLVRYEENDSDNETDSDSEQHPAVSHAEACKAFSITLQWLKSQEGVETAHPLMVKWLCTFMSNARLVRVHEKWMQVICDQ